MARVDGDMLRQVEVLRYHLDGERLVVESEPGYDDTWWKRHHVLNDLRRGEARTEFFYAASRAYNRVEGWSFVVGPRLERLPEWGRIDIEAFGVVRSASPMAWGDRTLGHDLRAEVQFGKPLGVALGARAFDVVQPTENWQMENGEVGLASVVLRHDFRDYYGRHGGEGYVRLQDGQDADFTVSFGDEQWNDARDRDPWSLFRDGGRVAREPVHGRGRRCTCSRRRSAWTRASGKARSGRAGTCWRRSSTGAGRLVAPRLTRSTPTRSRSRRCRRPPERVEYTRGFFDARRYTGVSHRSCRSTCAWSSGGWLGGDPLPTERKLSLGGPGTLAGYDFREIEFTPDVLTCSNGIRQLGTPGQCDRMALVQLELRTRLFAGSLRDDASDDWWRPGLNGRMEWVLFADMGRGWNVGAQDGGVTYPSYLLPAASRRSRPTSAWGSISAGSACTWRRR